MRDLEGSVSKFATLFPSLAPELRFARSYIYSDAASSLTKSRIVLEKLLIVIYTVEMGQAPRKPMLGDMLADNQFSKGIERHVLARMHSVRDMSTLGPHGESVEPADAARVLEDLCEVLEWYSRRYPTPASPSGGGASEAPAQEAGEEDDRSPEELLRELLRAEPAAMPLPNLQQTRWARPTGRSGARETSTNDEGEKPSTEHDLEGSVDKFAKLFPAFAPELRHALGYIHTEAASSLTKSRIVLEKLLIVIYTVEMGQVPRKPMLGEMLNDNQFSRKIERRVLSRMHSVRDMGNLGPYGEPVEPNDATRVLEDLCEVLEWYSRQYPELTVNAPDVRSSGSGAGLAVRDLEGPVSKFERLLPAFAPELRLALRFIRSDASSSLTKSRIVLERLLIEIYTVEMGQAPRIPMLGDMLADRQFSRKIERRIMSRMNSARDMGNLGPHGEFVEPADAARVLEDLCEVLAWYLWRYKGTEVPVDAPEPPPTAPLAKLRTGDEAFSAQTVVLRYPAPIAIAYRRFCARKEPPDRLAQLFSTFEITIKYLVYLAHSDLARVRVNAGPPYEPLPDYSGFKFTRYPVRMTLGQWLEALRTAADELKKHPDRFFAELPDVCRSGGALDREIVQWIKTNRNVWAHIEDGQSLTTEECSRLLPEARPRLERLFQEIDFVRRYPLGFVTAGYPGSGDLVRYRVHSCMGARVAHGEEVYPMETSVRFPVGVPFVVHPDETKALCLWPFLLYRESDATQRPALYVFRGVEKDERFMAAVEAVAIDHKDTWSKRLHPTAAADHNWLWEALAKLPQTVLITPELRLADGLAESLVGRLTGESLGAKKHIKLIGPIARGGFGTVYDAFDSERNVRVAVKVLEDREGLDPKEDMAQFKRFQQEYEKLQRAGAATAGFVRTFEWGTSIIGRREYPWFSMEFAEGGDLTARLEERRTTLQDKLPWNESEAREAVVAEFRAVAGAVANLHELNIVHRDVKPGNILVMDGGELRLSDFGLVKDLDRPRVGVSVGPGSTRGAVVGTRDYMAPEQERGETVTRAADVYALGILLAELTTGRRPLPSNGAVAGSPIERDERVLKLPEALRRLISRCTDLDPESRPEDAGHVLLEFEKIARKPG